MRVLVANRGEIAVRYIQALHELEIETVALHTDKDRLHIRAATQAVELPGASSFMDADLIVSIARKNSCTAIAPGYGFLSESASFAERCETSGLLFIGPSSRVLAELGDKRRAKEIARSLGVMVLPSQGISCAADISAFALEVEFPIMIKAQDGGGGKGIRIVRKESEIDALMQEALRESPSQTLFVEKAALEGFKHIEIQVIGDRHDNIRTIFERECSLQRKFQKVIEVAPSSLPRRVVSSIGEAALKMARSVKYVGLGTFEFLVNLHTHEFFFMECNPRIQVEHTITEQISGLDLVHLQLAVVLEDMNLSSDFAIPSAPRGVSIQCRLNAEDPITFTSSQGTLISASMPSGPGIRCDSILANLVPGSKYHVTDEYDSLLAKVITTSNNYVMALKRAMSAMSSVVVHGVTTNQTMLLGLLASDLLRHPDSIDIRSLSDVGVLEGIVREGKIRLDHVTDQTTSRLKIDSPSSASDMVPSINTLSTIRKGDAFDFNITLNGGEGSRQTVKIEKVLKNNFPTLFVADISSLDDDDDVDTRQQRMTISKSAGASNHHVKADPSDPTHIALPFSGTFIEMLVEVGDVVFESESVAVFRHGKMELDVRVPHAGVITQVAGLKEGELVNHGALVVVVVRKQEINQQAAKL